MHQPQSQLQTQKRKKNSISANTTEQDESAIDFIDLSTSPTKSIILTTTTEEKKEEIEQYDDDNENNSVVIRGSNRKPKNYWARRTVYLTTPIVESRSRKFLNKQNDRLFHSIDQQSNSNETTTSTTIGGNKRKLSFSQQTITVLS